VAGAPQSRAHPGSHGALCHGDPGTEQDSTSLAFFYSMAGGNTSQILDRVEGDQAAANPRSAGQGDLTIHSSFFFFFFFFLLQKAEEEAKRQFIPRGQSKELSGIDLLLRDGLLSFLLKINRFIPPLPTQVRIK